MLAALRPDVTVVLVEPLLRRATFLQEVVAELGLPGVVVRRNRAEELAGTVLADVVTARAVAPLERLASWALPLLHPGGRLLALKGERAAEELAAAAPALRRLGADEAEVVEVGDEPSGTLGRVVVARRGVNAPVAAAPGRRAGSRSRSSQARPRQARR